MLRQEMESNTITSTDIRHPPSVDTSPSSSATYTKEEINTLFGNIYTELAEADERNSTALEEQCRELRLTITSLKNHMAEMRKSMWNLIEDGTEKEDKLKMHYDQTKLLIHEMIRPIKDRLQEVEEGLRDLYTQKFCEDYRRSTSTDAEPSTSIDISNPEYCTKAEMEKTVQDLFTMIQEVGDSAYQSTEKLWFPVQGDVKSMEFTIENLQKEIKTISRQLAERPAPLESTDMLPGTSTDKPEPVSIDITIPRSIDKLLSRRRTYERLNHMQEELSDLSKHAYPTLRRHEFSIECYEARLDAIQ